LGLAVWVIFGFGVVVYGLLQLQEHAVSSGNTKFSFSIPRRFGVAEFFHFLDHTPIYKKQGVCQIVALLFTTKKKVS
jgi:hypothetical protein